MAGFTWNGSLDGSEPIIISLPVKDTVVLNKGEMVNLESGEADTAATNDGALVGVAVEDADNTNDGVYVKVTTNPGAIYAVVDANARAAGATLDIGSGGLTVAASSNADLVVVSPSTATEPTRVTFNANHYTG